MKKLSEQLSSLLLTTVILAVLMVWFTWGVLLAQSEAFQEGFGVMNAFLAPVWLSQPGKLSFLLKFWFIGLCFVMVVLGVNLVFCSWTKSHKPGERMIISQGPVRLFKFILFPVMIVGIGVHYDVVITADK